MQYIRGIILTLAVCQCILISASEVWGGQTKKMLRFLCGIILLLTLYNPAIQFINHCERLIPELITSVQPEEAVFQTEENPSGVLYGYIAERWISHISEQYPVKREQITIHILVSEEDIMTAIEVILQNCPYAVRRRIELDLQSVSEVSVTVKGE